MDGRHTHDVSSLPSLCLRSAFAPKVEEKWIQNEMKQPSTSPIHLSDEPLLFRVAVCGYCDGVRVVAGYCFMSISCRVPLW